MPDDLRAALGLVLRRSVDDAGMLHASVIGDPAIVRWLLALVDVQDSDDLLIVLSASPATLLGTIEECAPLRVVVLSAGRLARVLMPLRRNQMTLRSSPSQSRLRQSGYVRRRHRAVQGVGSVGWAVGERLCRRVGRFDIADRCRIAMQASLVVSSLSAGLGTILIEEYQRIK